MKIAFYAPLKSPNHPRPSGDRRIARLFIDALKLAGHQVELASELRAWEGRGCRARQDEIEQVGKQTAAQLIARYAQSARADRPDCWLTYHAYHKSPDWIGARVSDALGIPYLLAETSLADKQVRGKWARGHAQTRAALESAQLVFNINSRDRAGIARYVRPPARIESLPPFADIDDVGARNKATRRAEIARQYNLDANQYWLLCVAMMRAGDKFESYKILADTAGALERRDWQLLIAGTGAEQYRVHELFQSHRPTCVHFFGELTSARIYALMRASDLFVWPACNEAFGMAVLEAIACRLPVVAGQSGGIGDIIAHGINGVLINNPTGAKLAMHIEQLLNHPPQLAQMSAAARASFDRRHHLDRAVEIIRAALAGLGN